MSTNMRHGVPDAPPLIGVVPLLWDLAAQPAESVLGEIAGLGAQGVQWHDAFADLVAGFGLSVAEVYAAVPCDASGPAPTAAAGLRRRLDHLHRLGGDVLVVACEGASERDRWAGRADLAGTPRLTATGWQRLVTVINEIAEQAHFLGHAVAFHAHAGTFVETDHELATLLAKTEPELVGVCLDTGHHIVGGGDPAAALAHYGQRITHVHLKDVVAPVLKELATARINGFGDAVERRIFCPLGTGMLDLPATVAALRRITYRGWLMLEQDSSWEPPATAVTTSRNALMTALSSF